MNIREIRQEEATDAYLTSRDRRSIINACPRFGKIKVAIDIMKAMNVSYVWILAPRKDIFGGWEADMKKFKFIPNNSMVTFTSIKKLEHFNRPDLVIIDEPHELSINQQYKLQPFIKDVPVLGLTGTLTNKTKNELYDSLILDTCYTYTIDQGVSEGILADYQLIVHKVALDSSLLVNGRTEKVTFDSYRAIKENPNKDFKTRYFMGLKMINLIQNSHSKMVKTIELLHEFRHERVLVFCGVTEVADKLGIPVYHSKAREREVFLNFCVGGGLMDQLATIKMMQAGVTVNPINKGIINYMSGNPEDSAQKICRFLGFEYDNPDKKAEIHIICTNETFELQRLTTGLMFFDQSKITFK